MSEERPHDQPTHEHEWQPGPLMAGHTQPSFTGDVTWPHSVILVCRCGSVARVPVPRVDQISRIEAVR